MTEKHYIEFTVQAVGAPQDKFEAVVDEVAEALATATGVIDPDLGVDLGKQELTFCMTVDASGVEEAMGKVVAVARAALHAAGHATAGWESVGFAIPDDRRLISL
jgi:hypothetical protein